MSSRDFAIEKKLATAIGCTIGLHRDETYHLALLVGGHGGKDSAHECDLRVQKKTQREPKHSLSRKESSVTRDPLTSLALRAGDSKVSEIR